MRKLTMLFGFWVNFTFAAFCQWENVTGSIMLSFPGYGAKRSFVSGGNHLFLSVNGGVYASGNNGDSWTKVLSGPDQGALTYGNGTLFFTHGKNNNSDTSFYHTSDNGASWVKSIRAGNGQSYCNSMVFNQDTVMMALAGSGATSSVFFTTNKGQTWSSAGAPSGQNLRDLILYPGGYLISREYFGVYRGKMNNFGSFNWTPFPNTGLPLCLGSPCTGSLLHLDNDIFVALNQGRFRFDPANNQWVTYPALISGIILKTDNFLFSGGTGFSYSTDNGLTWIASNQGFQNSTFNTDTLKGVSSLLIHNGYIFAVTSNAEVFRRPLSDIGTTSVSQLHNSQKIFVYPNPAAKGKVRVSGIDSPGYFIIRNELGKTIAEGKVEQTEVPVPDHAAGMVFLSVSDAKGHWYQNKLLIEK